MKTFSKITIGQYYPASSPLHELDPRAKIIFSIGLTVAIFLVQNFWGFLVLTFFLMIIIFGSKVPWSLVMRTLRPLLYILIFTLVIHLFFTQGEVLLNLRVLKLTKEGLKNGVFVSLRLLLLVTGTSILTFTTTPIRLTYGLEYLLGPLKKLKVPVAELSLMMTIALRFIPTLFLEAEALMKAQISRGADFDSRNLLKRGRSFLPLLIPLFITAFRRSDELALAMESRGYSQGEGRTRLQELKLARNDWLTGALTFFVLTAVVFLGRL